jgi:hypothetical protein
MGERREKNKRAKAIEGRRQGWYKCLCDGQVKKTGKVKGKEKGMEIKSLK